MFEDRADVAAADEDGGGGDEKYEIKALRKTVWCGGWKLSGETPGYSREYGEIKPYIKRYYAKRYYANYYADFRSFISIL